MRRLSTSQLKARIPHRQSRNARIKDGINHAAEKALSASAI